MIPVNDADLIKGKKELKDLQDNKETNIYKQQQHQDQLIQQFGQIQTQTLNGVSGILQSLIKTDSGRKEEMQKLTEGFMQALNKFSETASKTRDDAKSNFDRFAEFLSRVIESIYRAAQIKG